MNKKKAFVPNKPSIVVGRAFTLIELLIGISVMMILMSIGIGTYNTYDKRNTLILAGEGVVGFIDDARTVAKGRTTDLGTSEKVTGDKLILKWNTSDGNIYSTWSINGVETNTGTVYHLNNDLSMSSFSNIEFSAGSGELITDRTIKLTSKSNTADSIEIIIKNGSTTTTKSF